MVRITTRTLAAAKRQALANAQYYGRQYFIFDSGDHGSQTRFRVSRSRTTRDDRLVDSTPATSGERERD